MKKSLLVLGLSVILAVLFGCWSGVGSSLLSELDISGYTITPDFTPETTEYSVVVPEAVDQLSFTIMASDPDVSIIVNGEDIGSGATALVIPLAMGTNTITVVVTANDGSAQVTYTVSVLRASSDATLSNLDIAGYTITPDFSPATTAYSLVVPEAVAQLSLATAAANLTASITANGQEIGSGTSALVFPLAMGDNTMIIIVTAQDGSTQKTYTVSVLRASSDATLSDLYLTATAGSLDPLDPAFSPELLDYFTMSVGRFTITPTATNANAVIRVEEIVVVSGEATVAEFDYGPYGSGFTYYVEVTAEDGVTLKTYSLTAALPPT